MGRAGTFVKQQSNYSAFIPARLPPDPKVDYDEEMIKLLSDADRKLGRLDGITKILPNPELFVAMYVKKEAVLSSQIEGTQASLIDILGEESDEAENNADIGEVVNYISAMNYGLSRLGTLPLSLRLIKEIHASLLRKGRGAARNPGEFRASQNWIGASGCDISQATFVPPPSHEMIKAMGDLEIFMNAEDNIPMLVKIGLIHAQFETIHPFLDGNGRMGRLLITFWLCQKKILLEPLLYLSYYFKVNRLEYYDRLMAVRLKDDWEGWIKFFLKGIAQVSEEATDTARQILDMREQHRAVLTNGDAANRNSVRLLDILCERPVITINQAKDILNISHPTASALISNFVDLGLLKVRNEEAKRNKKYAYAEYISILNKGTEL